MPRSKTPRNKKKSPKKKNSRTDSTKKLQNFAGRFAPTNTPIQNSTAAKYEDTVDGTYFVTGGTGLCGLRLVEMLIERGASRVVSYDIVDPPSFAWKHKNISWVKGDITNVEQLTKAMHGASVVMHLAAAVGPFHPNELYDKIIIMALNVIEAMKKMVLKN